MAQFRLTAKLAKELKITSLSAPEETEAALDDWYLDTKEIDGYDMLVCIHMKSLIGFALPFSFLTDYQGDSAAERLCSAFPNLLEDVFKTFEHGKAVNVLKNECPALFAWASFTKTLDRSVPRYAAEFMVRFENYYYQPGSHMDRAIAISAYYWMENPIRPNGVKEYTSPGELLDSLLLKANASLSNVIEVNFGK